MISRFIIKLKSSRQYGIGVKVVRQIHDENRDLGAENPETDPHMMASLEKNLNTLQSKSG